MSKIKAVIFDLDGTLLDTEKYYRKCWPQAAEHFGYTMTDSQALFLRSLGQPFAEEWFQKTYGKECDYIAIREYRRVLMEKCLEENGMELKPDAQEILQYLQKTDIVTAVATANPRERAVQLLRKLKLYHYFDQIVCADMVEKGKPAPDIYRYACEQLGFMPGQCIAVEDSPNGIMSAYRAGCKVVMVPDLTEPDGELQKILYRKVETLTDLKKYF